MNNHITHCRKLKKAIHSRWFYLLLILEVYGEKIKDEDRPYEFSFTIDSQQHRYEKKDINGIVQGEFGFITADGVYHVTVYATDENGNFKIISMKNIKISERLDRLKESELPTIPGFQYHTPTTSQQPPLTRSVTTTTTKPLLTTKRVPKFLTASTIRVGCGGCGIITTPPNLEEFFKARTGKIESKPIEYSHSTIQTKERAKNFYSKPNALVTPTRTYTATTSGPKYVELSTNTFVQSTQRPRSITVENSHIPSILIPKYTSQTDATVPKRELIEVTPKYASIPFTLTPPESLKVNPIVEESTALFVPRLITLTEATPTPKRELIEVTPKYTNIPITLTPPESVKVNAIVEENTALFEPRLITLTEATPIPKKELIGVIPKYTKIPITLIPPKSVEDNTITEGNTALFEPKLITLSEASSTPKRELIEVIAKYTDTPFTLSSSPKLIREEVVTSSYIHATTPKREIAEISSKQTSAPNTTPLPKVLINAITEEKHTTRTQPTVASKHEIVYTKQLPLKIPRFVPDPSKAKVENGIIKVLGNVQIPILDKYPNMIDGLPNGITKEDISDLLYKFNYTVGFHGHYEKGWRNGTKVGGYFVNGRDGYSRIVTYVADEFGYRPKFKLIRLGLDSFGTPKEDTEKSFGLQNFEFVWYPLN